MYELMVQILSFSQLVGVIHFSLYIFSILFQAMFDVLL